MNCTHCGRRSRVDPDTGLCRACERGYTLPRRRRVPARQRAMLTPAGQAILTRRSL